MLDRLSDVVRECAHFYADTLGLALAVYRGAHHRTKQGAHMQHLTDDDFDAIDAAYAAYLHTPLGSYAERDALIALDAVVHPIAQRLRKPFVDAALDRLRDAIANGDRPDRNLVTLADPERAKQHPSHPDYQPLGHPEPGTIAEYDGKPIAQPERKPQVVDLVAALRDSVQAARARRAAANRDRG